VGLGSGWPVELCRGVLIWENRVLSFRIWDRSGILVGPRWRADHLLRARWRGTRGLFRRMAEQGCLFRVSMVVHSMGHCLHKHTLMSYAPWGNNFLCDNILLAAADTNNTYFAGGIDRIRCRWPGEAATNEVGAARPAAPSEGDDLFKPVIFTLRKGSA